MRGEAGIPAVFPLLAQLMGEPRAVAQGLADALAAYEQELGAGRVDDNHQFAPLVQYLLHSLELQGHASPVLLEELRRHAKTAAIQALSRDVALAKIDAALQQHGCRAILLKGAALDKYLYPHEAFRLGVDVDLLLSAADYERAGQIFATIAQPIEVYAGRPAHARAAAQRAFAVAAPQPVALDVHREFAQSGIYAVDYAALFERSLAHPERSENLRVLVPEDNLLQFAIHAFKDKSLFQKQTVDAFQLLRSQPVDWPALLERARCWGVLMPLVYLLEGVRRVFAYEAPASVRASLRLVGARRWLAYRLIGQRPDPGLRTGVNYRLKQLAISWLLSGNLRGHLRQQVRYLRNRLRDAL